MLYSRLAKRHMIHAIFTLSQAVWPMVLLIHAYLKAIFVLPANRHRKPHNTMYIITIRLIQKTTRFIKNS